MRAEVTHKLKSMKRFKFLSVLVIALCCLTSCGGDDDESNNDEPGMPGSKSELVGVWDVIQTTTTQWITVIGSENTTVDPGNGAYWEFTERTVTIHDPIDLANNETVNYTYDAKNKTISISSFTYHITSLTENTMTLEMTISDENAGQSTKIEFRKR